MAPEKQVFEENRKRRFQPNVGTVIFLIIFLYIIFSAYGMLRGNRISFYEVREGSIVQENGFSGIILREEQTVDAPGGGHIHFFAQEGRRVGVGDEIFGIDDTGEFTKYLGEHPELGSNLSSEQLEDLQSRLSAFSAHFQNQRFSSLYEIKNSLDTAALRYSGLGEEKELDSKLEELGIRLIRGKAPAAGVVSYSVDGYEGLREGDIREELFQKAGYEEYFIKPGALLQLDRSKAACRLVTSSDWSIVFPLTEEQRTRYQDQKRVKLFFPGKELATSADLTLFTGADSRVYGRVKMSELMEDFLNERFLNFRIVSSENRGLKIPLSAVVDQEFYQIPKDYLVQNEKGEDGFLKISQVNGQNTAQFVAEEPAVSDEQFCYLRTGGDAEKDGIKQGDLLSRSDGKQSFTIAKTKILQGVYNINKGYCIFRQIIPLESGTDYLIAEANMENSVSVYDHIILNASLVKDGQLVY